MDLKYGNMVCMVAWPVLLRIIIYNRTSNTVRNEK
jgi:hypothetical protein